MPTIIKIGQSFTESFKKHTTMTQFFWRHGAYDREQIK